MTKTQKVIAFIRRSKNGRKFGEIQRFIVEMNGMSYDDHHITYSYRNGKPVQKRVRTWRGYWCDYLCDTYKHKPYKDPEGIYRMACVPHPGLLSRFCVKRNGRYYSKPAKTKGFALRS